MDHTKSLRRKDAAGQLEGKVSFLLGDHVAICLSSLPPLINTVGVVKTHFTEQETEASEVTCPRPHSQEAVVGLGPGFLRPQIQCLCLHQLPD